MVQGLSNSIVQVLSHLRRDPTGNEREVLTHPERLILTHLVLQDSRSGQGRQFRFTPPFGSSWTSSTRESGSSRRSSRVDVHTPKANVQCTTLDGNPP